MNREQLVSILRGLAILVVTIAGMFGLTIEEETAQLIVIGVAMVVIIAYGLWKNHNLTAAAALAQRVLDLLKSNVLTFEQVEQMIDDAEQAQLKEE